MTTTSDARKRNAEANNPHAACVPGQCRAGQAWVTVGCAGGGGDGLREAVTWLADLWEGWAENRSTPRIDAFRDAADQLRAALAAQPAAPQTTKGAALTEADDGCDWEVAK